jgi:HK97 gp10 family phage protein
MTTTTIKIEGLEDLQRALERAPAEANAALRNAMQRSTYRVQAEAQKRAPVDTGRLRASITTAVNQVPEGIEGRVGSAVFYAPYMEYGTGTRTDGTGGKGGRHWPPAAALNVWARRHGFGDAGGYAGWVVAWKIGVRGGLKPRRYLRGALQACIQAVHNEFDAAVARLASQWGR